MLTGLKLGNTVKSNSFAQLKEDFNVFPPVPLNTNSLNTDFDICVVNPKFFGLKLLWSIFRLVKKEDRSFPPSVPPEMLGFINEIDQSVANCKSAFDDIGFAQRTLLIVLLILTSPLVFLWCSFMTIKSLLGLRSRTRNVYGFFSPAAAYSGKRNEIVVNSSCVRRDPDKFCPIVSHEHIHVLQSVSQLREGMARLSSSCNLQQHDLVLSKKAMEDAFIKDYLFNEKEVEARLHELVLCHYRNHGSLPVTVASVAKMVLQNIDISLPWIYDADLGEPKCSLWRQNLKHCGLPKTRSKQIDFEFYMMSSSIKDSRAGRRYLYEILPIFYARLLSYYGGVKEAEELLSQIKRPSFYDEIYGPCE